MIRYPVIKGTVAIKFLEKVSLCKKNISVNINGKRIIVSVLERYVRAKNIPHVINNLFSFNFLFKWIMIKQNTKQRKKEIEINCSRPENIKNIIYG